MDTTHQRTWRGTARRFKRDVGTDRDPLLDRLASEELDSLERKILDEMRKASKQLGGPFSKTRSDGGNNDDIPLKIWSGIPGTGKSYQLQEYVQSIVQDEAKDVFRTVFHPEYSMYDFVGQIRPKQSSTDDSKITYPFEPGPFTRALRRAKSVNDAKLDNRVFLIIEELNRGNAAAIFGEIFQLLDFRDDGESQYGIVQKDIASLLGLPEDSEIRLPRNIYIYATMNISDQNVYALDTAFLRRWDREYVYADTWEGACTTWKIKLPNNKSIMWQEFAETVNNWLIINANEIGNPRKTNVLGRGSLMNERATTHFCSPTNCSLISGQMYFPWNCKRRFSHRKPTPSIVC